MPLILKRREVCRILASLIIQDFFYLIIGQRHFKTNTLYNMQNVTNASVPSNRRLSPLEQEQLQYCFPGTFAQLAQQGMGHCFPGAGLSMPEARVPAVRPLSFSSLDEGMGFNIMNPQPSRFYGFDKRTLAALNDIDDTNPHLKRETASPFGTG